MNKTFANQVTKLSDKFPKDKTIWRYKET